MFPLSQLRPCSSPLCYPPFGYIPPLGPGECCPSCACRYGGKVYKVGQGFPSTDGCNTWYVSDWFLLPVRDDYTFCAYTYVREYMTVWLTNMLDICGTVTEVYLLWCPVCTVFCNVVWYVSKAHTHTHAHTQTHTNTHTHTCTHTHTHKHTHTLTQIHHTTLMRAHVCMCVHSYVHICSFKCTLVFDSHSVNIMSIFLDVSV